MDKTFDPKQIESALYQQAEKQGCFKPHGNGPAFSIVIPPPNVTGTLHMGHGFQYTLMDILTRYHRMKGDRTLWQPGTDHAGIATQMVVERQLNAQGISRHDLSREVFLEKVWQWKQQSGNTITAQIRRLGASVDWSRERFTMDEGLSDAVTTVFCELYRKKIIYRGKRLVNWDPKLLTAISDLEVMNEEQPGSLWYIRYPVVGSSDVLIVATTRPETLLGDTAVAVHPDDARYQSFIGKKLELPLTSRQIPVIADTSIDPTFGTGCVKITPAHDFNDYATGARHGCDILNIFTPTAHLNDNVPEPYRGLERFEARKKIISDLEAEGLLEKIVPHTLMLPIGDRSGVVIEPYLTDQWYVDTKALAADAIQAVNEGRVEFIPDTWKKTYDQWMENIEDWCISRQIWWGHRIPAWYDQHGQVYVGETEASVRAQYQLDPALPLTQDNDVLDTWFSSALWPFSTLGFFDDSETFHTFYPTNVLITGFDIIFFWVARMIMMSLEFTKEIPFKKVYITGLIRDADGQKMSKSKGNILDPIDVIDGIDVDSLVKKRTSSMMQPHLIKQIEKATRAQFPTGIPAYGTDALRFTFCAMANNNRHLRFDLARTEGYRNFCNKLWNATRFVLMNTSDHVIDITAQDYGLAERWILTQLQKTIQTATEQLEQFRFDFFAQTLYEFIWYEYCDWYVELAKATLSDANTTATHAATVRTVLLTVLEESCRLLHPIMPFITETLFIALREKLNLPITPLCQAAYPTVKTAWLFEEAYAECRAMQTLITQIRTIRSEMNIAPTTKIALIIKFLSQMDKKQQAVLLQQEPLLKALAKVQSITYMNNTSIMPASATAVIGNLEVGIPLQGLIDKDAELARLTKELAKLKQEMNRIDVKLANPHFAEKAPKDILAAEQEKRTLYEKTHDKLQAQFILIEKLR